MQTSRRTGRPAAWLLASTVAVALGVEAQEGDAQQQRRAPEPETSPQQASQASRQVAEAERDGEPRATSIETWSQMQGELLHAEELLEGEVTNGVNPIGSVSELILSEDGSRVELILLEVPYPYSFYGGEDGFIAFEGVEIFRDSSLDLDVHLPAEVRPQGPEKLRLSAAEAERRLVSRLIGERLYFSENVSRRIEDLLIDRETGEILDYVIETDPDTLFGADPRTVPAEQVSIDDEGRISAAIELAALDDVQEYDSELL